MTAHTAHDVEASLRAWFDAGHSRFALILQGDKSGSVLLASNQGAEAPALTIRQVISNDQSIVTERREQSISMQEFAADSLNSAALIQASQARLAGAIAPPPICPTIRSIRL